MSNLFAKQRLNSVQTTVNEIPNWLKNAMEPNLNLQYAKLVSPSRIDYSILTLFQSAMKTKRKVNETQFAYFV